MDSAILVQNIKLYCKAKGVLPTVACKESGVGASFINNIETRGQTPSVAKVQMMATYLGCTVSDLLGEVPPGQKEGATPVSYDPKPEFLVQFEKLDPETQREVLAFIAFKAAQAEN